jgi:hypothetical protein
MEYQKQETGLQRGNEGKEEKINVLIFVFQELYYYL